MLRAWCKKTSFCLFGGLQTTSDISLKFKFKTHKNVDKKSFTIILLSLFWVLSCNPKRQETTDSGISMMADSSATMVPDDTGPSAEDLQAQAEEEQRIASINSVLQADANTSSIANPTSRASAMRNISLTGCPSDFAVAYVDHIHAWEHSAEVYAALGQLHKDENIRDVVIQEGLSRLLGLGAHPLEDAADAEKRLDAAKNETDQEISSTFEIVERVAVKYGATLPR